MPRTRRSTAKRKFNYGLGDEDKIEEHGQQQNEQQPNLGVVQQPIEKQVMAPSTRRAIAYQNAYCGFQGNQMEEHGQLLSKQQVQPQISQLAPWKQVTAPRTRKATCNQNTYCGFQDNQMEDHGQLLSRQQMQPLISQLVRGKQVITPRTRKATRNQNRCHRLRDEDRIEEHGQLQSEQQPNLELTEQPIEKQVTAPCTRKTTGNQNTYCGFQDNQMEDHGQLLSRQQVQPQISQLASGKQVMTPRTRKATRNQNGCHRLRDDRIEEHGQLESEQQPNLELTEQPIEKQVMAPRTRRASVNQNTYCGFQDNQMEVHGQLLSRQQQPQISQLAREKQVMTLRTRKSTRNQNGCHRLQDEDKMEEHGQLQSEQQPNLELTQQPIDKQVTAPRTRRATVNQNNYCGFQDNPIEEHGQQQSRQQAQPQISQQASRASRQQVMAARTQKATRDQNECDILRDEHQIEGYGQCQNEEQLEFQMTQQTIDQQRTTKQTRGPTYLPDVWARKPNEGPMLVEFNKRGQPIGPNKKKFTGFLGTLARNGKFAPLDIEDWRKVPQVKKDEMIKMVKERFEVPQGAECWILLSIGKKRRNWKSRVKTKCFNPTLPIENQVGNIPVRVNEDQWKNMLPYWAKEDVKEASEKNKDHRRCSILQQTTGKLSFAEIYEDLKEQLGRSPTRTEMFDVCYTDSNGNPANVEVGAILTQMREYQSTLAPGSLDSIGPNDSYAKVIGKDPHGRVRMLGLGVNPSDVWGGTLSRSTCHRMVLEQAAAMARIEEKMDHQSKIIAELQERMQQQNPLQQNPNNISMSHPPASLGQSSNSFNLGNGLQVGGSVLLKSMFDLSKIVAKGCLRSVDPNQEVGGRRLGSNWCKVQISVPIDWDEDLIRPFSNLSTIGDAVGTCIAWPRHLVIHACDQE